MLPGSFSCSSFPTFPILLKRMDFNTLGLQNLDLWAGTLATPGINRIITRPVFGYTHSAARPRPRYTCWASGIFLEVTGPSLVSSHNLGHHVELGVNVVGVVHQEGLGRHGRLGQQYQLSQADDNIAKGDCSIVIVGGLISDLVMSIFLLPTLYVWMAGDKDVLPEPEGGSMNRCSRMKKGEVCARIEHSRLYRLFAQPPLRTHLFAAEAVSRGGLPIVELTMTVPKATELIAHLAEKHPHLLVGVGTVLDVEAARACIAAGAKFITSPGLDLEMVAFTVHAGVIAMPGALTPSEIIAAVKAGADFVKIFPCAQVGGADYIHALKRPFPRFRSSQPEASISKRAGLPGGRSDGRRHRHGLDSPARHLDRTRRVGSKSWPGDMCKQ